MATEEKKGEGRSWQLLFIPFLGFVCTHLGRYLEHSNLMKLGTMIPLVCLPMYAFILYRRDKTQLSSILFYLAISLFWTTTYTAL